MFEENHILTASELADYQKQGYELDEHKMYIIKFLFNDKWNNAASWKDPTIAEPFRIKTELVERLAKDAVGMPYVVNPKITNRHLKGSDEGLQDTPEDLLKIQALHSYGIIKVPIINPNKNVYGIIEIFKDYEGEVENGNIPPFVSPSILPLKSDEDGISDAQFINLNGVDIAGYTELLAGTHGVCKNGIKECVTELAVLGASGKLKSARDNTKTFLNNLSSLKQIMSSTEGSTPPPTEPENKPEPTMADVVKAVEEVSTKVDEVKEVEEKVVENVETNNVVLKEVATVTEGVDETKVKEKIDEASAPPADEPPTEPAIVGASGKQALTIPKELRDNPFVQKLVADVRDSKKTLAEIQKEAQARKDAELLSARTAQATSIVERLIASEEISADKRASEIKKYVELKNEDGSLVDISTLDNYLKSKIEIVDEPAMIGASGYGGLGLRSDPSEAKMSNAEAMGIDA